MRQAEIIYNHIPAGILTETDEGLYQFEYYKEYIDTYPQQFLTFTMPVREKPYVEKRLFPFFEGMLPEGWLLNIVSKSLKINENDRMGLLLACCYDCVGAVGVIRLTTEDDE